MTVVLRTQDLTKRFASILAVDGLSMHLQEGSITALLGGNGAGKVSPNLSGSAVKAFQAKNIQVQ